MKGLAPGANAVPAPITQSTTKQQYRLITVGKKKLLDPEGHGSGSRRKEIFWATVTAVGDDLASLEKGLGGKTYNAKMDKTRSRVQTRGAHVIVNTDIKVMSKRETHHIFHPKSIETGNVQSSLGIYSASSFVLQVKNPRELITPPGSCERSSAQLLDKARTNVGDPAVRYPSSSWTMRAPSCCFLQQERANKDWRIAWPSAGELVNFFIWLLFRFVHSC